MEIVDTSPDDFLASLREDDIRAAMIALDDLIASAMPGRCRVLWEGVFWGGTEQQIIGYGDLVQPRSRGADVEWFIAGLARQKNNYSIYLNAVENGAYLAKQYEDRLGKVKLGAASIGFRSLEDVNRDVLTEMLAHASAITPPDRDSAP